MKNAMKYVKVLNNLNTPNSINTRNKFIHLYHALMVSPDDGKNSSRIVLISLSVFFESWPSVLIVSKILACLDLMCSRYNFSNYPISDVATLSRYPLTPA